MRGQVPFSLRSPSTKSLRKESRVLVLLRAPLQHQELRASLRQRGRATLLFFFRITHRAA